MPGTVSLCTVAVGSGRFGIETLEIREVLGRTRLQRIPLAPDFVAGVVAYRGEVLTVLSLRAMLGLEPGGEAGCVLVFHGEQQDELYGIEVDSVAEIAVVQSDSWQENPSTLDPALAGLFRGCYRDRRGLVVRLEPREFAPSRLISRVLPERPPAGKNVEAECTL